MHPFFPFAEIPLALRLRVHGGIPPWISIVAATVWVVPSHGGPPTIKERKPRATPSHDHKVSNYLRNIHVKSQATDKWGPPSNTTRQDLNHGGIHSLINALVKDSLYQV